MTEDKKNIHVFPFPYLMSYLLFHGFEMRKMAKRFSCTIETFVVVKGRSGIKATTLMITYY